MNIKKLPQKKFLESFKFAPRIAVNILVVNKKDEVLLTKRAIPPKEGSWHYPGGFILRGEKIDNCFRRISEKELGIKLDSTKKEILGAFENIDGDPRGHIIDLIYEYKLTKDIKFETTKETLEVKFFKKLPAKIGFNHRRILNELGYR